MKKIWNTPSGSRSALYASMLEQPHLLIAGATGSGKSVVINGLIHAALFNSPGRVEFILIDPKRVELAMYRDLPHTLRYASEPADFPRALDEAMDIIDTRYKDMQRRGLRKYDGGHIYVVIDELADMMTTAKREIAPRIQRIAQVGRAANVHLIVATQCPLASVIPTAIKVNFDARLGLRTRCAQDSRNILDVNGCESLPRHGQGYYLTPEGLNLWNLTMIPEDELNRITDFWLAQKPRRSWFAA